MTTVLLAGIWCRWRALVKGTAYKALLDESIAKHLLLLGPQLEEVHQRRHTRVELHVPALNCIA